METPYAAGLMWFRRDLRAHDNAALRRALARCRQVHCVFVFDREILDALPRQDRRVEFIHECLVQLDAALRALAAAPGAGLIVRHAVAAVEVPTLARTLGIEAVFANRDYEPDALERDDRVRTALAAQRIVFHLDKDQVVFEGRELLTQSQTPYTVFTPYKRAWLAKVGDPALAPCAVERLARRLVTRPPAMRQGVPSLAQIGFEPTDLAALAVPAGVAGARRLLDDFLTRIDRYGAARDFPSVKGPSYLSVHLRFGTLSVREAVRAARSNPGEGSDVWLGELIWRDFYFQILANFPHVTQGSFKPAYDAIDWETGAQADELFAAWCEGRTGYPLVDAAMVQLNRTGYMHNRLRMVTASFLTKDLGIDWRRGERYFAEKLLDYDLAANNGGWQWAASTGCDAQPYFRIFNPVSQSRKFDAEGAFIAQWLPQLADLPVDARHAPWETGALLLAAAGIELGKDYPRPVVDHDEARARTLSRYGAVRQAPA
ncbi:deoxyribodipyrimidine photo-lyase [Ramlibacter sp. WS9]|uniref:cryptochrome/photolyase family protein n=1 Tax=Ramlibacter sp. WS9 TaxID=1882741 RepID=UPI0011422B00|nr:deoxyribodipyrimidine photo-lyase [Ramlibacter sp. WS9]ROZ79647.1 deoxyribodipyrimidine photo-lyase [Ramlibacter sp. WS9]